MDLDGHARNLIGVAESEIVLGARKEKVLPASLGAVGGDGAEIGLIVLVDRPDGELDPVSAFGRMLDSVFSPTVDDVGNLDALARICESIPVVGLRRTAPTDMADAVEALVQQIDRPPRTVVGAEPRSARSEVAGRGAQSAQRRRQDVE